MAYLRKWRGHWRAEVQRNGIRRSAVWPTRSAAKAWADKLEAEIEAGLVTSDKTFADAAEKYLRDEMPAKRGAKRETFRLRALMAHFDGQRLAEIDTPQISEWRTKRSSEVSPWSVLREASILKSLFRCARDEWRWMEHDPFRGVRLPKDPAPRHQRWTWREIRRVLRFLGYRRGRRPESKYEQVALAFAIALATGLRAGEILKVRPEALRADTFVLHESKTDPYARVPLTPRGRRLCALVQRWTIDEALLDALFRKARNACLVEDLRFHDARATALTWLSRKLDPWALSRISRHKDLSILLRTYYRETPEEVAKRLRK